MVLLLLDLDADCLQAIVRSLARRVVQKRQCQRAALRQHAAIARLAATCWAWRSLAHDAEEAASMRRCCSAALLDMREGDEKPATAALARRRADGSNCDLFACLVCAASVVALCPETCCLRRRCRALSTSSACLGGVGSSRSTTSSSMRAVHCSSLATAFVPESRGGGVFALEPVAHLALGSESGDGGVLWTSARCVFYDAQGVARARSEPLLEGRATNVDLIGRVSLVPSTRPTEHADGGSPNWADAVTRVEAVDGSTCVVGLAKNAVLVLRVDARSGTIEVERVETDLSVWCHASHCVLWDGGEPVLGSLHHAPACVLHEAQDYVLRLRSLRRGESRRRQEVRLRLPTGPRVDWVAPVCVARGTAEGTAVVVMCTGKGLFQRTLHAFAVRSAGARGEVATASHGSRLHLEGGDRRATCVPVHGKGVLAVTSRGVALMHDTRQTVLLACNADVIFDADAQGMCAIDLANEALWAAVTPSLTDMLLHGRNGSVWRISLTKTRARGHNVVLRASFDVAWGARLSFLHDGTAALQLRQGTILLSSDRAASTYVACQSSVQTACRFAMVHAA